MERDSPDRTATPAVAGIDRLIHEPARLMLMATLFVVDSTDFLFLMRQTGLTQGNLSSHMGKLEEAGYVEIEKAFKGKRPHTVLRLTPSGRSAFAEYRGRIESLLADLPRNTAEPGSNHSK